MSQQHTYYLSGERIRANLQGFIGKLPLTRKGTSGCWKITVEWAARRRSQSQNNLVHKWFDTIAKHTGYTADEVKELLCRQFLPTRVITLGGIEHEMRAETSKLDKLQMMEFMTRIEGWAAGLGVMLPTAENWEPENEDAPAEGATA